LNATFEEPTSFVDEFVVNNVLDELLLVFRNLKIFDVLRLEIHHSTIESQAFQL